MALINFGKDKVILGYEGPHNQSEVHGFMAMRVVEPDDNWNIKTTTDDTLVVGDKFVAFRVCSGGKVRMIPLSRVYRLDIDDREVK